MWRTRVRTVAQELASLQAFVPWCSSFNSLILRNGEVTWRSELLQRLQEVRGNCKTRNQLTTKSSMKTCVFTPTHETGILMADIIPHARSRDTPLGRESAWRHAP